MRKLRQNSVYIAVYKILSVIFNTCIYSFFLFYSTRLRANFDENKSFLHILPTIEDYCEVKFQFGAYVMHLHITDFCYIQELHKIMTTAIIVLVPCCSEYIAASVAVIYGEITTPPFLNLLILSL